jgi:hypothetical protein
MHLEAIAAGVFSRAQPQQQRKKCPQSEAAAP